MTIDFTVEDGTGLSNATSYVSIDELKQYFFNNGYDFDSLDDNTIMRLLNKSTLYVDSNYQSSWPGYIAVDGQSLLWPRVSAYYLTGYEIDEDEIPKEVKDAVCEMAYMINAGTDPFANIEKTGQVKSSSVAVDVIKESYSYFEGTTMSTDIYTKIDSILAKITGGVSDRFVLKLIRVGGESP